MAEPTAEATATTAAEEDPLLQTTANENDFETEYPEEIYRRDESTADVPAVIVDTPGNEGNEYPYQDREAADAEAVKAIEAEAKKRSN